MCFSSYFDPLILASVMVKFSVNLARVWEDLCDQTLIEVLLWRYSVRVANTYSQLTLSKGARTQYVHNPVSWKTLKAKPAVSQRKKNFALRLQHQLFPKCPACPPCRFQTRQTIILCQLLKHVMCFYVCVYLHVYIHIHRYIKTTNYLY